MDDPCDRLTHPSPSTHHYNDVIMSAMASQPQASPLFAQLLVQRKHQSSASLAFVRGIHPWPVNSPHKRPVTRKMFPFGDVIMCRVFRTGKPKCHFDENSVTGCIGQCQNYNIRTPSHKKCQNNIPLKRWPWHLFKMPKSAPVWSFVNSFKPGDANALVTIG